MSDRRPLSAAEKYYIWMKAGGLCSFDGCRKRLVSDSDGALTNVGIIAHIIGHAKNSARHEYAEEYGFDKENLEDVKNLTLMCQEHAKKIDDEHTRHLFPPDKLFKMKEEHEKWVDSWSENKKRKSIALIHKRLGPPITELNFNGEPPCILLEAVEDQLEFVSSRAKAWEEAKKTNEILYEKFRKKLSELKADEAEVFPLSPIPLLIHMGFLLTDTIPITVYQYDRENQIWVSERQKSSDKEDIVVKENITLRDENELAITVNVSGTVRHKDVDEAINNGYDLLEIGIENPNVKGVLYKEDVQIIQKRLKALAENLMQTNDYSKIHLFYAGPAGLAIEIGRGINPRMWQEVCLYQYEARNQPRYQYTFSL
jgi:hypothetical protein